MDTLTLTHSRLNYSTDYTIGLAFTDITTGECSVTELPLERLELELGRLQPVEVLVPAGGVVPAGTDRTITTLDPYWFEQDVAAQVANTEPRRQSNSSGTGTTLAAVARAR